MTTTPFPPAEQALIDAVSVDNLMETNAAIAQFVRHSGTDEEREAVVYVEKKLNEYGLTTTLLEHPALVSYPLSASLAVIDESGTVMQSVECLGTAFSASVEGMEAELVDVGYGTPDDFAAQDVTGKLVLINGLATPTAVYAAEQAGSAGQIFINDDHRHYMIVSSIWGTPTPKDVDRIPSTPSVSLTQMDGHALRARIQDGPVRVRLSSDVFMDWQQTPILIGELPSSQSDDFVLFSGHLDSWEVGAMDNGSANATMLEVARLMVDQQAAMQRGLRLVFWSGHSHGRYSGSTWYADNHWENLHDYCVAHVNVDSTGAKGATFYKSFPANLELGEFGAELIQAHTGQESTPRRMSRAGDMSFNGMGVPALFMCLSQVPLGGNTEDGEETNYVSEAFAKLIGGGMPYWWHTSEDTMDKVDPDVLLLDTQVYVSTLWQLCTGSVLPMDFRPVVADIRTTLRSHQDVAGEHFDLSQTLGRIQDLAEQVELLLQRRLEIARNGDAAQAAMLNETMKRLSRILIPITYMAAGPFDQDPAWGLPHLPILADVPKLAKLDPESDEYHFLHTQLVRNRNQVNFALRQAVALLR